MTLNNILYTHRSACYIAITRKASSCRRWYIIRDPQLGNVQRVKKLKTFSAKWNSVIKFLPLSAQKLHGRQSRNIGRAKEDNNVSSRHNRVSAPMN